MTVRVPATSANLGCGFDVFGLALALYTDFIFDTSFINSNSLKVEGEGAATLMAEKCGLVYEAMQFYAETQCVKLPPFSLFVNSRIPLGRGLGSSAAAIVGGLVGAAALVRGHAWENERETLLALATQIEGHPDNVAPALCGGLVVAVSATVNKTEVKPLVVPLNVPEGLEAVLFIPDFEMSTKAARAVLPTTVPFADAVHNMGRTGLFAAIFASPTPPLALLAEAMNDRLHQPYRTQIFPQLPLLIQIAQQAGAYGAALSGAGSSVLALVETTKMEAVSTTWEQTAARIGLAGRAVQLAIASDQIQATLN